MCPVSSGIALAERIDVQWLRIPVRRRMPRCHAWRLRRGSGWRSRRSRLVRTAGLCRLGSRSVRRRDNPGLGLVGRRGRMRGRTTTFGRRLQSLRRLSGVVALDRGDCGCSARLGLGLVAASASSSTQASDRRPYRDTCCWRACWRLQIPIPSKVSI